MKLAGLSPLLVTAAVIVALQGTLVAVLAVLVGVDVLRGRAASPSGAEIMVGVGVVVGVGLVLLARGLLRRRRWSRSPTLVVQLLCVPTAIVVGQNGHYVVAVALGVTALVAGACVLSGQVATELGHST